MTQIILIIEPDRLLGNMYQRMFEAADIKAVVVSNAQAAILAIDKLDIGLVIAEVLLPHHNGIEFLYELRSYPEWEAVPIIILSSLDELDLRPYAAQLADMGVVGQLYKPSVTASSLIYATQSALDKRILLPQS